MLVNDGLEKLTKIALSVYSEKKILSRVCLFELNDNNKSRQNGQVPGPKVGVIFVKSRGNDQ